MSTQPQRYGSYRVGDAERNRTAELLKEAHVAGYLTFADIDERLDAALAARTRDDLERLVADLPPEWRQRQAHATAVEPAPAERSRAAPSAAWWLVPLAVVLVGMIVIGLVTRGVFFPWPLLWILLIFGRRRARRDWRPPRSDRITWV
jgi:hypothetical protein